MNNEYKSIINKAVQTYGRARVRNAMGLADETFDRYLIGFGSSRFPAGVPDLALEKAKTLDYLRKKGYSLSKRGQVQL